MTPHEQNAKELYRKFLELLPMPDATIYGDPAKKLSEAAIACAVFHVEGMIDFAYDWNASEDGKKMMGVENFKDYWQQIKSELLKMKGCKTS